MGFNNIISAILIFAGGFTIATVIFALECFAGLCVRWNRAKLVKRRERNGERFADRSLEYERKHQELIKKLEMSNK